MTDPEQSAEIIDLESRREERAEQRRQRTARLKRKLLRAKTEADKEEARKALSDHLIESEGMSKEGLWIDGELPKWPGGIDDLDVEG